MTETRFVVEAYFPGSKERVLKISPLTGAYIEPNVLAGQWISRLALANVTAPEMNVCEIPDGTLGTVIDQLNNRDDVDVDALKKLKETIRKVKAGEKGPDAMTAAMVSEPAGGQTIEALLGKNDIIKFYKDVREAAGTGTVSEDSYRQKLQQLDLKGEIYKKKLWPDKQTKDLGNLTNDPTSLQKQDELVNMLDTETGDQSKAKFELQMILAKRGGSHAQKAVKAAHEQVGRLGAFQRWIKGPEGEGRDALIRMAAADVILGMEDRLIKQFNGANFTFDGEAKPPRLICIDNAKAGPHLYSELDYETWFSGFATLEGTLAENLQKRFNEMGVNGTELVTPEHVRQILLEVAAAARDTALLEKYKDEEGADKIRERGRYVLNRVRVEDELAKIEKHAPPKAGLLGVFAQPNNEAKAFIAALNQATVAQNTYTYYVPSKSQKDMVSVLVGQWMKRNIDSKLKKNIQTTYNSWSQAVAKASEKRNSPQSVAPTRDQTPQPGQAGSTTTPPPLLLGGARRRNVQTPPPSQASSTTTTATSTTTATNSTATTGTAAMTPSPIPMATTTASPSSFDSTHTTISTPTNPSTTSNMPPLPSSATSLLTPTTIMTNRLTQPGSDQGEKTLARELWAEAAKGADFPEDATPEECKIAIEIFTENGGSFDRILNLVMEQRSVVTTVLSTSSLDGSSDDQ